MGWRGMRMIWLLAFLALLTLLLILSTGRHMSTFTVDHLTLNASSAERDLPAFSLTATSLLCGSPDPFTKSEDARVVELYFADRAQSVNHFDTTAFLLQPRLAVCAAGGAVASDDRGSGQSGRDADWDGAAAALDMLVLVPSPPDQAHVREAIRKSWGSAVRASWPFSRRSWKVGLIFLLGRRQASVSGVSGEKSTVPPPDAFSMTALTAEQDLHGDLLLGDFEDSYRNLTLKMLTGLWWVSAHCATGRIRHVLKADQDTFVHLDLLLTVMEHLHKTQPREVMERAVMGEVLCSETVERKAGSRVRIDPSEYPFALYPPYVRGGSYLMAGRLVSRLVNASRYFPVLPVEDAYLNGVVARALQLKHVHLQGVMRTLPCRLTPCLFLGTGQLTATNVDVALMEELWQAVQAGPGFCQRNSSLWTQACQVITHWTYGPGPVRSLLAGFGHAMY